MIYLLDTVTFSDLMRGDHALTSRLQAMGSDDRAAVCTTVRGEILYGIMRLDDGHRRRELTGRAEHWFQSLSFLPQTIEVADAYATLKDRIQRRGLPLDTNDLWIAATALAFSATMVTRDEALLRLGDVPTVNWAV